MTLIVNIIGILFIVFIIWWFWLSKSKSRIVGQSKAIVIKVASGIYDPAEIICSTDKPVILQFLREDESPCAEIVIFSQLNISKKLPLNHQVEINLGLVKPGEYEFTCQMNMYRGKLIVHE